MDKDALIAAVNQRIGSTSLDIWYIGVTNDCTRRKGEHEAEGKSCKYWRDWEADTEKIARDVETYFISKGMKGGIGGGEHPTYVYVF